MPTYDFKCQVCSSPKPVTAGINEEIMTPTCDNCQVPMARDFTVPAVVFKGEGWGGSK